MIMRRGFRILLALYLGGMFYLVTTVIWGPQGIEAMKELSAYKMMLEQNIVELEAINRDLNIEVENLKWADQVALDSRILGYYQENERVIRLSSGTRSNGFRSIGIVLNLPEIQSTDQFLLRAGGGTIFFMILFILEWGFSRYRKKMLS